MSEAIGPRGTKGRGQTLSQYADRRHALAGRSLLSDFNPFFIPLDKLQRSGVEGSRPLLNFAEYDYLSFGKDPRVRAAASHSINEWGVGAGASRLVGGERSVHGELESDIARFVGTESALTLVSGYGTNVALVGHLLTTNDLILVDEYSHNSIMVGTKLSRAETQIFAHNNLDELSAILENRRCQYQRVLVVVEGLYSMEGDIPDLPRLVDLCERHNAWLMIDEAHSIGVLGATGRGICEHFNVDPGRVDLIVGTLSKAFAACGGFICAKSVVIDWLRYTLNGFVYSVGLLPHVAAAVRTAIGLVKEEPWLLADLRKASTYFVDQARQLDFDVGSSIGVGVIPVKFSDTISTLSVSEALLAEGIYVPPVVQIGVPKDKPRLRFFITASHTTDDIDRVFDVMVNWRANWEGANPVRLSGTAARSAAAAAGVDLAHQADEPLA
jgi:8-amino-7-oxononanoate synthase